MVASRIAPLPTREKSPEPPSLKKAFEELETPLEERRQICETHTIPYAVMEVFNTARLSTYGVTKLKIF